ncbi:MAG: ATP synthase F0 subunit B, partial [Oscillospiraceae bacterium]|nr:ATP synthase F0 subunit B [Oscillospiraceae bacterium]
MILPCIASGALNLEFLSIDPGTIVGTLLNTLILFLVIKHFLFGKVNQILEERKKYVEDSYSEADKARETAKALEAEYDEKIRNAKEESADIIRSATLKAQQRSDEIVFAAKNEA